MTLIPEVGPLATLKLPSVADETLPNGLRVLVARRPGIPRFEARLHIPTARAGTAADPARRRVLAKAMLGGTKRRSSVQIAEDLQGMGGGLQTAADAEEVVLYGAALATELRAFLELLGELVMGATYPRDEVAIERERAGQDVRLMKSQPATIAGEAFLGRLYGRHPYGRPLPAPETVERVSPAALQALHAERLLPAGSVLVIVGDVQPAKAVQVTADAFAGWKGKRTRAGLPKTEPRTDQPTLVVDRPGAVQTNIRIGGAALTRTDPDHPSLALANLVFGGYFAARLSDNIREKRGYTYGAYSRLEIHRSAAHFAIATEVGTEVTVPALIETRYELTRMVAEPPAEEELLAAKRYLAGTLAMSIATQSGLASYLSMLALNGLPLEYLRDHPKRVDRLTAAQVHEAAVKFLSPKVMTTVLVGDASRIAAGVEALDDVEVRTPSS